MPVCHHQALPVTNLLIQPEQEQLRLILIMARSRRWRRSRILTPNCVRLLERLAQLLVPGEPLVPVQQRLADDLSVSLSTIRRSLARLRTFGFVVWERRRQWFNGGFRQRSSNYALRLPDGQSEAARTAAEVKCLPATAAAPRRSPGCQKDGGVSQEFYKEAQRAERRAMYGGPAPVQAGPGPSNLTDEAGFRNAQRQIALLRAEKPARPPP